MSEMLDADLYEILCCRPPWAETAAAIAGHMLFDAEGHAVLQVTNVEIRLPQPALERPGGQAQSRADRWSVVICADLEARHPKGVTRRRFSTSFPRTTPRGTWILWGFERVPAKPDVDLDAQLAGRINTWFEYIGKDEVERVRRLGEGWDAASYHLGLNKLIERFISSVAEKSVSPGPNALAHHHILYGVGRIREPSPLTPKMAKLLASAWPVLNGRARVPDWAQEGLMSVSKVSQISVQAAIESQMPTVPLRLGFDARVPIGSALVAKRVLPALTATSVRVVTDRQCVPRSPGQVRGLSTSERAVFDPSGVVKNGTRVKAGQPVMLDRARSLYEPGGFRDVFLRAPETGRVVEVERARKPGFGGMSVSVTVQATHHAAIGDPIGLLFSGKRCGAVRIAGVELGDDWTDPETGAAVDLLVNPDHANRTTPGVISVVRIGETRPVGARLRHVPDAVLCEPALRDALSCNETGDSHLREWGPRWRAGAQESPVWSRARRMQSFLALFGCALALECDGIRLVPVAMGDLWTVTTSPWQQGGHHIPDMLHRLGPVRARETRLRVDFGADLALPFARSRRIAAVGLPMFDLLLRDTPNGFGALLPLIDQLIGLTLRHAGRVRVTGVHPKICNQMRAVWEQARAEIASALLMDDPVTVAGWTPIVVSHAVPVGEVMLSPGLAERLGVGQRAGQRLVSLTGKSSITLKAIVGTGQGCVLLNPIESARVGGDAVFCFAPKTPDALDAARRLEKAPAGPPKCWLDDLVAARGSSISEVLEDALRSGARAPLEHPTTVRLFGALAPLLADGGTR